VSADKRAEPDSEDADRGVRTARGRHAPPPEVRLPLQRRRLLLAAATEFAERGYSAASAASVARRAGMSKATFYSHFGNKEDCILALYDRASEVVAEAMADAARSAGTNDAIARLHAGVRAYLEAIASYPEFANTLLVEIIGAGPKAIAKRDQSMQAFADILDAELELAPVIDRLIDGVIARGSS
jgi:AcrR family transcriptional regulator